MSQCQQEVRQISIMERLDHFLVPETSQDIFCHFLKYSTILQYRCSHTQGPWSGTVIDPKILIQLSPEYGTMNVLVLGMWENFDRWKLADLLLLNVAKLQSCV